MASTLYKQMNNQWFSCSTYDSEESIEIPEKKEDFFFHHYILLTYTC